MRVAKSQTQLRQLSTAEGLTSNQPNTSDSFLSQRLYNNLQALHDLFSSLLATTQLTSLTTSSCLSYPLPTPLAYLL